MRASCCFIEPSCRKVEIHYPYSPGKMNTALSDKMTLTRFSPVLSGCFIILLMCGHRTVLCLPNDDAGLQPNVTATTAATGEPIATCGSGPYCESLCSICEDIFSGPSVECLSALFHHFCMPKFNNAMDLLNTTDWCVWGNVNSLYSNLSICTEEISDCLQIPWPNPLVEQIFVDIHSTYFKECPTEEFSDPPPATVFALVITPICLIPIMVSLVVLKTKNGDGSS
uniref:Receptor (G protein-coupled) activity modifying protein 2 n=2 Tax=Oryzias latipes TaxID=8090 RepID=A0A3B3ICH3_ORYLA